jgi:hypothetical protein
MKFCSNVRDVMQQQFMSVRCLSRDEPAVLIDDHSRTPHLRETVVVHRL